MVGWLKQSKGRLEPFTEVEGMSQSELASPSSMSDYDPIEILKGNGRVRRNGQADIGQIKIDTPIGAQSASSSNLFAQFVQDLIRVGEPPTAIHQTA